VGYELPGNGQGVGVILGEVVSHARQPGVGVRTAEGLGVDLFAGRGLDQGRAAEKDCALFTHDDGFVAHRRDVSPAGRARAHHNGDLRNIERRQAGLIVEDPPEMIAVRKDFVLQRQEGAPRVDQVQAGQVILQRDLLGAQVLLHRHRVIGAAFDRGIVGYDQTFHTRDAANPGNHPGTRRGIVIQAMGGQGRDFQERAAGIQQCPNALARQQLAARLVFFSGPVRAATSGCFKRIS